MHLETVPGYTDLFLHDEQPNYEDFLNDIDSEYVIFFCSACNNELKLLDSKVQKRLLDFVLSHATDQQLGKYILSIENYKRRVPFFEGTLFGSKYLLQMLSKEIKRNRKSDNLEPISDENFYKIFLAYLVVVDELNNKSVNNIPNTTELRQEPYPVLWQSFVDQFEYSHHPDAPVEFYKLFHIVKYFLDNYPEYLKEYLLSKNFKTVAEYFSGIYTLTMATFSKNDKLPLKAFVKVQPTGPFDSTFLDSYSINNKFGKDTKPSDFKIFPLYKSISGEYFILDNAFFIKKIYRGLFFDLYRQTALKKKYSLDIYMSNIASEVLEKRCFRGIIDNLTINKHEIKYYDDNTDSLPDLYYRYNKKIALIEYKGYTFPIDIPENPSYDTIKKYMDMKFVKNEGGKNKGVLQLSNNISKLINGDYKFDENVMLDKSLTIYPVICHNDFYFSLPGLSDYLNNVFKENLPTNIPAKTIIKDVIVVNNDMLFNFWAYGYNMNDVFDSFDAYIKYKASRKKILKKKFTIDNMFSAFKSYDEYFLKYFVDNKSLLNKNTTEEILLTTGLNQEIIDKPIDEL